MKHADSEPYAIRGPITHGSLIEFAMRQKRMTQSELAKTLGVAQNTVSKWMLGRSVPEESRWPDIAEALDISIAEIAAAASHHRRPPPPPKSKLVLELLSGQLRENSGMLIPHPMNGDGEWAIPGWVASLFGYSSDLDVMIVENEGSKLPPQSFVIVDLSRRAFAKPGTYLIAHEGWTEFVDLEHASEAKDGRIIGRVAFHFKQV